MNQTNENDEQITKLRTFILDNDYDSDAIEQDLEDHDENEDINQKTSNLCNLCNDTNFISSILQFIKNIKCYVSCSVIE